MPLVLSDRVKVRSRSTGLGSFLLEDTVQGFRSFSVIGNGNDTYYGITDSAGNWEIGRGTYTVVGSVESLSRDLILSSSNNDTFVNFPAGSKNVFCTFPAQAANSFSYNLSAESALDGGIIRLAFSEGTNDDVKLTGSDGITVTRTDENTINISADVLSVTQSAETTSGGAILRLDKDGDTDDVAFLGSSGVVITRTDANTITITSDISVTQSAETTSGGAILRLDQSGVTDDVTFQGTNGVEVSRVDANTIKIDATEASGLAIVMGL